jgi:hypothetical protein
LISGQPLKGMSHLAVSEISLVLLQGSTGSCPQIASCRYDQSCIFRLTIQLQKHPINGSAGAWRELVYPLSCRTRPKTGSSVLEEIYHCEMMGAPSPSPSPRPSICVGDVTQDGEVDELDLKFAEVFLGPLPRMTTIPDYNGINGLVSTEIMVSNSGSPEEVSVRWEPMGTWPNPQPSPSYSNLDLNQILQAYQSLNVNSEGSVQAIDGRDQGEVLANWGCKSQEPPVCFEDSPFYPLYRRLAKAAEPLDALNSEDLAVIHFCASESQAENPACLALNLDGKCSFRVEPLPGLTGQYCRAQFPPAGQEAARLPGFKVIGRQDLAIATKLLELDGYIWRYRATKWVPPPPGDDGSGSGPTLQPCLITRPRIWGGGP